jgi:hypothetical protein
MEDGEQVEQASSSGRLARWMERMRTHAEASRAFFWYERHKRLGPPLFFFGGVVWDALTLRRTDAWIDNVLLLMYLIVLGGVILAAALVTYERTDDSRLCRFREWYPPAIQFLLGALFSANVVFYFQSASLAPTSLFLVLLVILLIANEFVHERLFSVYLLLALYFLAACSFFIFFVPVVTKVMNYAMFLASCVLGVGVILGMLAFLWQRSVFQKKREYLYAAGIAAVLFGLLNLFYLEDWIPPVPLALRHGGVYHQVSRVNGAYQLRGEQPEWYAFWEHSDDVFHRAEGEPVYCFAAVFAPTELKKRIFHEWNYYDAAKEAWVTTDRIGYEVVGGRFNGYRGYTFKHNVQPGAWRIDVETETRRTIGRIYFDVVPEESPVTDLKEVTYN